MSHQEANEQARRNYAIEAFTLGEEYFLQLNCGEEILATVSADNSEDPAEFVVFNGTGMTDEDEEDPTSVSRRFPVSTNPMDAWREAARYGYLHALSKMMVPDQRADREIYSFSS